MIENMRVYIYTVDILNIVDITKQNCCCTLMFLKPLSILSKYL